MLFKDGPGVVSTIVSIVDSEENFLVYNIHLNEYDLYVVADLQDLAADVTYQSVSLPVVQVVVVSQTAQENGAADELIE